MSPEDADLEISESTWTAPRRIGRCLVLRMLGEGGMGRVFKAWHPGLASFVAIKVLARGLSRDPQAVKDFEREGRTLGQMHHENVARAMDFGTMDGMPYMVMEYVHGIRLDRLLRLPEPPDLRSLLLILRDIARGLEHAHAKAIVHRDLKPANVMLDRAGLARVMDLGLGRRLRGLDHTTIPGSKLAGTYGFMSPEQTRTKDADLPSDIFSFGVVAYYVLTREKPFGDPDLGLEEHFRRVRDDEPTPIEALRPEVSTFLAQLIHQMLRKDPAARPTASQVLDELEQELQRREVANGRELLQRYAASVVPEDTDKPPSSRSNHEDTWADREQAGPRPRRRALDVLILLGVAALLIIAGVIGVRMITKPLPTPPGHRDEAVGSLELHVTPALARVTLDGARPAPSDGTISNLEPGAHRIRAEMTGYPVLDTVVNVVAGRALPVSLELVRFPVPPKRVPAAPSCEEDMRRAEKMGDGEPKARAFASIAAHCLEAREHALYRAAYVYSQLGDPASRARARALAAQLLSQFPADDDDAKAARNLLQALPPE